MLAEAGQILKAQIFRDCADILYQECLGGGRAKGLLIQTQGLTDADLLADNVVRPLLYGLAEAPLEELSPRRLAGAGVGTGHVTLGQRFGLAVFRENRLAGFLAQKEAIG